MAEQPPLSRIHVVGYSSNDRDFPIVSLVADPRVAGYRVPEDLSTCPDKRYPNHVFTGAQPLSGDERVRHTWEILPTPYVPFTRYDDDLGPVQGRRRFVANSGQEATLERDRRVTFEAREGSAIVSTEIEESWDAGSTDPDVESPFPIKDRDFYEPSRGAVQERRQLVSTTGNEVATLENKDGVITQTSYEAYNEFLSFKVVQTYSVDGPQLVGRATDNDGQLVTVTTQRKGSDNYTPPSPTATRTVEVNREDAESLVERIVDTPEVFKANTFSVERPDPIPQKFRVAVPVQSSQEIVEGDADPNVSLDEGELSKSEEQRNKFIKRVSSTSRDQAVLPQTLTGKSTNNERQEVVVTETLQQGNTEETPTATKTVESEALGDGNYVITKTQVEEVFGAETFRKTKEDLTPQKFKAAQEDSTTEENVEGVASPNISLATGEFAKSEQQVNKFVKRVSTTARSTTVNPDPLVERVLTNEGQIGTRTLTLASGDQTFTPSSTLVDANVEALGDGRTVKTEVVVPNVFTGKTVQKSRIDLTPEKFKAEQEDITTEESVEGVVDPSINLATGEFRKSEQQVTEFVKRVSSTTRDITASRDLEETVITNQGQVATRTLRLSTEAQSIQPDALLVDGSIEELGDGRTVKTEVKVGEVFPQTLVRVERPVTIPERFLTSNNTRTEAETIADEDPSVEITGDIISQQVERTGVFTARTTTVERSLSASSALSGADYDETSNVSIPFTESIQESLPTGPCEGDPLGDGKILVKQYNLSQIKQNLESVTLSFPTRASITGIPPILRKLDVLFEKSKGESDSDASGNGTAEGNTGSVSIQGNSVAKGSVSVIPKFIVELEEVNAANVPTTSFFFFLQYPVTLENILNKVGASPWPVFKTKSYVITATGQKVSGSINLNRDAQRSFASESSSFSQSTGFGNSRDISNEITVLNIPPCIHSGFTKNVTEKDSVTVTAQVVINLQVDPTSIFAGSVVPPIVDPPRTLLLEAEAKVQYSLPATSVSSVPTSGKYLINSNVQPYKFGFAKVYAEVVDASIFS